ncbi:NUDIX hydrolase [Aquabacter sp. CN5-332]|uniref:NUDIX hydrolase n=1 Tax=Aquabacter sp. CN5-332 TaxID=3156608 RepID=UPI0032B56733
MSGDPPRRPGCAALAVVVREGRVLLVRRANPPDAGLWGFPGGRIEWGETAAEAAVRELMEETSVSAAPGPAFRALDALDRAADGTLLHHYVLVAVLCRWVSGEGVAADDALEAAWFSMAEIAARRNELSLCVDEVAEEALRLAEG